METCIVGCKLPHGLEIDLDVKKDERGIITESKRLRLKGANASKVMGGYGITRGVPKASFVQWLKDHARAPFVINGAVFMELTEDRVRDKAKEGGDATGLEQIDPLKKSAKLGTDKLEMGDDEKKALLQARAENPLRARQVDELQIEA